MIDLFTPEPDTPADTRDALLVAMAEQDGWHCLAAALPMELEVWRAHCIAGRWVAFQFAIEDGLIWGMFTGTAFRRCRKRRAWTGTTPLFRGQG